MSTTNNTPTKLKPAVSFIGEAPADGERILKDVKKLLTYDRSSGKIGTHWYALTPTDTENTYSLKVETIKRVGKETNRHFRTFSVQVKILNRIWRKNDRGLLVPVILTNAEMKQLKKTA